MGSGLEGLGRSHGGQQVDQLSCKEQERRNSDSKSKNSALIDKVSCTTGEGTWTLGLGKDASYKRSCTCNSIHHRHTNIHVQQLKAIPDLKLNIYICACEVNDIASPQLQLNQKKKRHKRVMQHSMQCLQHPPAVPCCSAPNPSWYRARHQDLPTRQPNRRQPVSTCTGQPSAAKNVMQFWWYVAYCSCSFSIAPTDMVSSHDMVWPTAPKVGHS